MEKSIFSKILIPLDVNQDNKGVLSFVKYVVGLNKKDTCCEITLFHVLSSSFFTERLANIDFRARELADSSFIKGLRDRHVEADIMPKMEAAKRELVEAGVPEAAVKIVVEEGEPVEVIAEAVKRGGFDALVLQRSCSSPIEDAIMGSVTAGLLHRHLDCPIYVVGGKLWKKVGTRGRLLVAVDGSEYANKALEQAAAMAVMMGGGFDRLYLCHVVELMRKIRGDLVFDVEKLKVEGDAVLDKAMAMAEELGLSRERLEGLHEIGKADEVLAKVCREKDIDILFLGRKGMSALEEVFMGSVSRSILNRCVEATVALVS